MKRKYDPQYIKRVIAAGRQINANRTPGHWRSMPTALIRVSSGREGWENIETVDGEITVVDSVGSDQGSELVMTHEDAAFICAASRTYGELLDLLEGQQAKIAELDSDVDTLQELVNRRNRFGEPFIPASAINTCQRCGNVTGASDEYCLRCQNALLNMKP